MSTLMLVTTAEPLAELENFGISKRLPERLISKFQEEKNSSLNREIYQKKTEIVVS